ncbi:MAG: hypothetical protein ABT15_32860 [Pseudonocardia sp. SCN 73-27]|nr:MAG: hypothetical protein ABS80_02290 [Pseudonocardia sp. SCN 72-51]ODU98953.1 MAG: hypothetical protein ABT15_32860 [Pseudonocardia sp. SCN 73-27]
MAGEPLTLDPPTQRITVVTAVPRLAAGVELIGEYQGAGFRETRFLAAREDGQVVQLTRLLFVLASHIDGRRDLHDLAADVGSEYGRALDAFQVGFLIDSKLGPAGLLDMPADAALEERAGDVSDPLLALRHRVSLVSAPVAWRIAGVFTGLFRGVVPLLGVVALLAVDVALVVGGAVGQVVPSALALVDMPVLSLLVFALTVAAGALHECGHVAACRYSGARPGTMGVGLYLVWPAFFSTVTDSYRLDRGGRLRTDLGGVYVNALVMAVTGLAWLGTGAPWLLVFVVYWHIETLRQFIPSVRLDGYYILSDLIGVPDLFSRLFPVLLGMLPGREPGPRVRDLRPRARRIITTWVVLVVPGLLVIATLFVLAAPQVLPVVLDSAGRFASGTADAVRAGDVAAATLGALQTILLVLPWIGVLLIVTSLMRTVRDALERRRERQGADPLPNPPPTWPILGRAAVLLAGIGVVVQVAAAAPPGLLAPAAGRILDAAYAGVHGIVTTPLALTEWATRLQFSGYATLTDAFTRATSVTDVSTEVATVAWVVLLLGVAAAAWRLHVPALAAALAFAVLAVAAPAVLGPAQAVPGLLGAAWCAVGGSLLLGRGRIARWSGIALALVGVVTAPVLLVPVAVAVAAATVRRSPWIACAATAIGGAAAVATAGSMPLAPAGPAVATPLALIVGAAAIAVAAAVSKGLRGASASVLALVAVTAVPGPGSAVAGPALAGATVLLGSVLVTVLAARLSGLPRTARRGAVLATAVAAAVGMAVTLPRASGSDPTAHRALASWLLTGTDGPVAAPPGLRSDLIRDGLPASRLDAGAPLVVDGAGSAVAAFGSGAGALRVTTPDDPASGPEADARRAAGAQLDANPRLDAPADVRAGLRAGAVDSRVLVLLAGLTGRGGVQVVALPAVPGEDPALPRHVVEIRSLTPAGAAWVAAQRAPYAPDQTARTVDGVIVSWRVPAPLPLLGPPREAR